MRAEQFMLATGGVVFGLYACHVFEPPKTLPPEAIEYAAQLEACVVKSATKEEWHACHCKVDMDHGRRCPFTLDAGVSHAGP